MTTPTWIVAVAVIIAVVVVIALLYLAFKWWMGKSNRVAPQSVRQMAWTDGIVPDSPTRVRANAVDMSDPESLARMIQGSSSFEDKMKWCSSLFDHEGLLDEFNRVAAMTSQADLINMCDEMARLATHS